MCRLYSLKYRHKAKKPGKERSIYQGLIPRNANGSSTAESTTVCKRPAVIAVQRICTRRMASGKIKLLPSAATTSHAEIYSSPSLCLHLHMYMCILLFFLFGENILAYYMLVYSCVLFQTFVRKKRDLYAQNLLLLYFSHTLPFILLYLTRKRLFLQLLREPRAKTIVFVLQEFYLQSCK